MTTSKGPRASTPAPRTLEIAIRLGGFKFTPEQMKPDGTRKKNPEVVLEATHDGEDRAEELCGFLTHARGDLKVAFVPAKDTNLDGWKGIGTIGSVKIELDGDTTRVRFPIKVSTHLVQTLEDLIGVRLAMSKAGEDYAVLELEAVEPDLDFEGGDAGGE